MVAGDFDVIHRGDFDPRQESLSVEVVAAVGEAIGEPIEALEPLGALVDTDALDAIVREGPSATDHPVFVTFEYAGFLIVASSRGWFTIVRSPQG